MHPQGPSGGRKGRLVGPNVLQKKDGKTTWEAEVRKRTGSERLKMLTISGGNDEGVPPVPIPNTEVKPFSADGT